MLSTRLTQGLAPKRVAMEKPSIAAPVLASRSTRAARLVAYNTPSSAGVVQIAQANGASLNGNGAPAQQTITVHVPEMVPGVLPPAAAYANTIKIGAYKAAQPAGKIFVSGILAGCYIAFGAFLAIFVGGNIAGIASANYGLSKLIYGLVFPVGLMMVMLSGTELYTGNTAVVTIAWLEKKATLPNLLKNWVFSYAGNLVGSLIMAWAVVQTGLLATSGMPVMLAEVKTALPLSTVLVRSILCNWLVCIAVWQANAATSLPGKVMGLWPPIAAFVTIGLEHSVANMFFVPIGILMGAKVTFWEFCVNNLIPVTVGNTIAGAFCLAFMYALCYGTLGKNIFGTGSA